MTTQVSTETAARRRAQGGRPQRRRRRGAPGSVALVLAVAAMLVAAATAYRPSRPQQRRALHPRAPRGARHYRGVLAVRVRERHLAAVSAAEPASPLIKAVIDEAVDGVLVTDNAGRVIYANAAYLDLIDAVDANDMRPVERVFIGDADASEAIYRLLKAAREGTRLQEEVRVAGMKGGPARWLRLRVRPLGGGQRAAGSPSGRSAT